MKFEQFALAAAASLAMGAAASAQQVHNVPVFEFDVERAALHDEANTAGIYARLVSEAGEYCGGIVAPESVEYPVCVGTMVSHVINELDHAPLARFHDGAEYAPRQQAVAYNAG
ncbi:UrcA family protein [Glycocaulis abyssi]|uniref:UrcA family protein n=1 Tax=Glycocaulis abyssi TaxID=1433403 RepID=A0ABV9NDG0_9PROT